MTSKLRYPCKIAKVLVETNTEVEVLSPDDDRVNERWPGMQPNQNSTQVAVQFKHLKHPTLVHISQLTS